jgi:hypothetical protein
MAAWLLSVLYFSKYSTGWVEQMDVLVSWNLTYFRCAFKKKDFWRLGVATWGQQKR